MYEVKKPIDIKSDMMDELLTDIDKREGSFSYDMAAPVAEELGKMYEALDKIRPMVWVDETSGIYLDMAAEDIGMEPRKKGTPSKVMLTFTGTAGYIVQADTAAMTDDDLVFTTIEDIAIGSDGTARVSAVSENVGSIYNVEAESINLFYMNDSRLTAVTNLEPALGGTDPESDKNLFVRLQNARRRPATSGNKYHYEQWATEVSGVYAVKVFPLWNGNGTVKVIIADENRQPVDSAIVNACFNHIEDERPTTARVTVVSVSGMPIVINVSVNKADGYSDEQVMKSVEDELSKYLISISMVEYEVRYNKIGAIVMGSEGVLDYSDLTINNQVDTITLSTEEVPLLGGVLITWT